MTNEELMADKDLNGLIFLSIIVVAILIYNYWRIK